MVGICYHWYGEENLCRKLRWISEEEMLDMTAIAQSAPGALESIAIVTGYRIRGIMGAPTGLESCGSPLLFIIISGDFSVCNQPC